MNHRSHPVLSSLVLLGLRLTLSSTAVHQTGRLRYFLMFNDQEHNLNITRHDRKSFRDAQGVIVIIVENGYGEPSSYCDGKFFKIPRTGLYFRTCEDGADWHLIPCRISPRSEFFSQAYKNWHIMWGINLGLDWPPLARGSNFHTIHTPTKAASLPPLEQWKILTSRFRRNSIS